MEGKVINIEPLKLKNLLKKDEAILFDVRSQDQYEKEHITFAKNNVADSDLNIDYPKTDKIVCVHCNKGGRSSRVAKKAAQEGKTIYNLVGGINAWKDSGLETE